MTSLHLRDSHPRSEDSHEASPSRWRAPVVTARVAAGWAIWYACYRAYYAAGGRVGMIGTPVSEAAWQTINAMGALIILAVAVAPLALLPAWEHAQWRRVALAACWVAAVGGVMHATVDMGLSVASLVGRLEIKYPFWAAIDRRAVDIQKLALNEPWFLVEGLLWAAMAWNAGMRAWSARRDWIASAGVAVAALSVVGWLSGAGVIGRLAAG